MLYGQDSERSVTEVSSEFSEAHSRSCCLTLMGWFIDGLISEFPTCVFTMAQTWATNRQSISWFLVLNLRVLDNILVKPVDFYKFICECFFRSIPQKIIGATLLSEGHWLALVERAIARAGWTVSSSAAEFCSENAAGNGGRWLNDSWFQNDCRHWDPTWSA